jgi:hypothetical protein
VSLEAWGEPPDYEWSEDDDVTNVACAPDHPEFDHEACPWRWYDEFHRANLRCHCPCHEELP